MHSKGLFVFFFFLRLGSGGGGGGGVGVGEWHTKQYCIIEGLNLSTTTTHFPLYPIKINSP